MSNVPVTTGSNPKLLWPGMSSIWGIAYKMWSDGAEWKRIFEIHKSNKNYEEDVGITPIGRISEVAEGDSVPYSGYKQGFVTRYQNIQYLAGIIVTRNEIEDNLYAEVGARRVKMLAFSTNQTIETVCANFLNRAFSSSYPIGDGEAAISDSHPIEGGTFSNTLDTPADLSEAALEDLVIRIYGFVDQAGNTISIIPNTLIIPRQLEFVATRILKNSQWRPDTADRDINALYVNNTFPGGFIMNHYLTNQKAWFIKTNCPDGLKFMDRISPSFEQDNDFDTYNAKFKVRTRFSVGLTDPRGLGGSPGA